MKRKNATAGPPGRPRGSRLLRAVTVVLSHSALAAAAAAAESRDWDPDTLAPLARAPMLTVTPQYPEKARRERLEGRVSVCFHITAAGEVRRAYVLRSTHRWFNKPALKAIRASAYEPAPGAESACRTFYFRLKPVERP